MMKLQPARGPLRGTVVIPGDKSLSHRAALLAPLAGGPCRASGWLDAEDTRRSLQASHDLGARSNLDAQGLTIWPGAFPRGAATGVPLAIDCGNSGTTARLLCGLLAGLRGDVILTGDPSLCNRPMSRVVEPLRRMGADFVYLEEDGRLPLRIRGSRLRAQRHELAQPSAQVKSALLLAGLTARGQTEIIGGGASRDHSERMLATMGAHISVPQGEDDVPDAPADRVAIDGGRGLLRPFDLAVPADPSSAAFLLAAALLVPGSRVTVERHSLNPTRTGFLAVLKRIGAAVSIEATGAQQWPAEPIGKVTAAAGAPLRAFSIGAAEVPPLIDELPMLAVLATQAEGQTVVSGAAELRVKESDRIALMVGQLQRLGADIQERPDGFVVRGPTPLVAGGALGAGGALAEGNALGEGGALTAAGAADQPVVLTTAGDHRVAMALAVAALITSGPCALDDADCVAISFPNFFATLERLFASTGHDTNK